MIRVGDKVQITGGPAKGERGRVVNRKGVSWIVKTDRGFRRWVNIFTEALKPIQ